jgi:uridine kinase
MTAINTSCSKIVAAVKALLVARSSPVVIALDGGSGCGKSTIAACVAKAFDATIIPCDDFFAADIPDAEWNRRTAPERARDAIDCRRIRTEVLAPLLAGQRARWHAFDFVSGQRADGTYGMHTDFEEREPGDVIILDGIYSARPELADLVNLSVLIDVPVAVRHARLADREEANFLKAWHKRWDAAEAHYLTQIRPRTHSIS